MTLLWNPIGEMEALRREVERAFENFGLDYERHYSPFWRPFSTRARVYPLLNVTEDHDNLYIEAVAPGLNPESLDISIINGTLQISGEKQALCPDIKPEDYHRNERNAGKFTRTITPPIQIDSEKIKAEYHDGLLSITAPKVETAKPKQISINVI